MSNKYVENENEKKKKGIYLNTQIGSKLKTKV